MLRPIVTFAAVGVAAFAAWQILSVFLLPLLVTVLKFALIAGLAFMVWWLITRRDRPPHQDAPAE